MTTVFDRVSIDPTELEQYAGKWVAVRDGEVVASATSLEELRKNPDVRREDAVYIVPERHSYFFQATRLTTPLTDAGPLLKIGLVAERPGEAEARLVEVLAMVDSGAHFSCFPLAIASDLGITNEELVEDPYGGTGVGSTFCIWRSRIPIRAGIGLFDPAPDGSVQPWGQSFDLDPAFTEHDAFLLGRADFFRAFTVTFEIGADGSVFHLDTLA